MLRDARELDDASTIECDLCIIGAGAAGGLRRTRQSSR